MSHRIAGLFRNMSSRTAVLLITVFALIALDQASKISAMHYAPSVKSALASSGWSLGLGWHIHVPDGMSSISALFALLLIAAIWWLPISPVTQVLWTAAAISNHLEMLVRPGTVDFLAFKFGSALYVMNLADIYVGLGVLALGAWAVRHALHQHTPVPAGSMA